MSAVAAAPGARSRGRLAFAGAVVMLAAADTYVVVLALPAIIGDIGISLGHLEQATPIISGFLLGYVAFLPMLGRLSDILGRGPVLAGCLLAFAAGSLVTASAHDLAVTVVGRTLQGAGGGGLVPVTLALVADGWIEQRRGVPLGIVGGVQELGAVLGPLYGAAIISVSSWRLIFWVNVPFALLVGVGFALMHRPRAEGSRLDTVGLLLGCLTSLCAALAIAAPPLLTNSDLWGLLYAPLWGTQSISEPLALAALLLAAMFVTWEIWAGRNRRVLLPLRRLPELWTTVDLPGALLLAAVLGCIVITFASVDPSRELLSPLASALLPLAAVALFVFVIRERRHRAPLIPLMELRPRAAWGALLTNLPLGAALIAALVDVPILARATAYPDSQLAAALVLLRFLVAVPVGAVIGGFACSRLGYRLLTAAGMVLAAVMFAIMATWSDGSIGAGLRLSDAVLAACGLGFGLAIAPVNSAILGAVDSAIHGIAAALVVVARMMGMLVGVSLLTVIGLHSFYIVAARLPAPSALCPASPLDCPAYNTAATGAVLSELHAVFWGAAVCSAIAALVAAATLQRTLRPVSGETP